MQVLQWGANGIYEACKSFRLNVTIFSYDACDS